jgi:hypothetical protein
MKKLLRIVFLILLLSMLAGAAFYAWASDAAAPMPEAEAMLLRSDTVEVDTTPWLTFKPAQGAADTGFIFYPGGRVDPAAYAPAGYQLAEAGYLAVIVPMPLNLAFFAPGRAQEIVAGFPEVKRWVIGGHSLGGAMAAQYVYQNPGAMQGLVLWASYPAQSTDLSDRTLPVLSIYGSLDGLATVDEVNASRALLPPDALFIRVEGGNHAQFGWYGDQDGDRPAAIPRLEQQRVVISATLAFLDRLP